MSEGMLGLVPLDEIRRVGGDLLVKLGGSEGPAYFAELKKFGAKQPCWSPPTSPGALLETLERITLSGMSDTVVASHLFRLDPEGSVPITYVDPNFTKWFGRVKIEKCGESIVRSHRLTRQSRDWGILATLEPNEETTLGDIYQLMVLSSKGREGYLLKNRYANIFYVRDADDNLREVIVDWCGSGWLICAYRLDSRNAWNADFRAFSRN